MSVARMINKNEKDVKTRTFLFLKENEVVDSEKFLQEIKDFQTSMKEKLETYKHMEEP